MAPPRPIRVLLVEDNPGDARLTQALLEDCAGAPFELTQCARLAEAKNHLLNTKFDAVLLDLSLPDAAGLDGMIEFQLHAPDMPIVVLTGTIDEDLALDLVEAGAQDYLVKGRVGGEEIGRAIRISMRRKEAEINLRQQALHDSLTGLPNRALFERHLNGAIGRARRYSCQVAVMYLDLDRFKEVNDTLGHDKGDELLVEVAKRLLDCVRETDTVARLGGDEFGVILENTSGALDPGLVADKIVAEITRPVPLGRSTLHTSTSIGIAIYPDNSTDPVQLVKEADSAMYTAKRAGRSRVGHARSKPLLQLRPKKVLPQGTTQPATALHCGFGRN